MEAEKFPVWVKRLYVFLILKLKVLFQFTGLLSYLEQRSKQSVTFHYFRSLFSIYQLDDMIKLDVPWWTYPAITALEKHIQTLNHPIVFEYGSGASTVWLAKRCAKIISIEHDPTWYEALNKKIHAFPNIELYLKTLDAENYVKAIKVFNQQFDLIIIDGRCRNSCLEECIPYLKPSGIIVFDNSNRERYQRALMRSEFKIERFPGWVPGSPFKSETSFIKKTSLF